MRRLPFATLLALSAAPLAAGFPPDVWFSPCGGPAATCVSPAVADADPSDSWTCPDAHLTPIPDDAREVLRRWESASQTHLPVTEAERLRLRFASPERSGHEMDLACEFLGKIDANDLARRYDWMTVSEVGDLVELTAVPKDEIERLFYGSFSVTLDAKTWRPTGLLCGRLDRPGTFANTTIPLRPWADDPTIRLVGFESDDSDPSATDVERPIRTADLSDESPRLTRDDAPLALPPAPVPFDFVAAPLEPVEAPRPAGDGRDVFYFYVPVQR